MDSFEIVSSLISDRYSGEGVLFAELKHENYRLDPLKAFPTVSNLIMYIIVLRGTMNAVIDNIRHTCTPEKQNLVNVKLINTVTDIRLSRDFRGLILVVSRRFMDEIEGWSKTISFYDVISMRSLHAITLDRNDVEIISDYYHIMEKNSDPGDNSLDRSVFLFAVQLCHLKILQQIFSAKERSISKSNATRASMLCAQFFCLVERYIEKEHTVGFYADELSITPHYLTKITNEFTGLSANRIITNELISRASILLRHPDYTLQQIADRLYFSDQSSFGKFFKKHTGKTPLTYRKDSCLPSYTQYYATFSKDL